MSPTPLPFGAAWCGNELRAVVHAGMRKRVAVTHFVLGADAGTPEIEIEVRIVRVGNTMISRKAPGMDIAAALRPMGRR